MCELCPRWHANDKTWCGMNWGDRWWPTQCSCRTATATVHLLCCINLYFIIRNTHDKYFTLCVFISLFYLLVHNIDIKLQQSNVWYCSNIIFSSIPPWPIAEISSSSSWRKAISRSIPPLRFAAKTICPQPAREHQSPIFPCPGGSDGSMWWEIWAFEIFQSARSVVGQ